MFVWVSFVLHGLCSKNAGVRAVRNKRPSRTQYVIGLSPAPPRVNVDVSARPTAIRISGRLSRTARTLDATPTLNMGVRGVQSIQLIGQLDGRLFRTARNKISVVVCLHAGYTLAKPRRAVGALARCWLA
jgi:hypothetical protein